MRLKSYLLQISPVLSKPEAVRRLLRLIAIVLSIGILSGVYNFLLFTFNTDISQRRGYMSVAIAQAHTFFTNREALLESLSLSAVHTSTQAKPTAFVAATEEARLLLGSDPANQWNIWLTRRMRDYMKDKQVSLLYVSTGPQAQVRRLYDATTVVPKFSSAMLDRFQALDNKTSSSLSQIWLTDQNEQHSHLYIFVRLEIGRAHV